MKKNSIIVNMLFYTGLLFFVVKTISTIFNNMGNISNFQIIIYILLTAIYVLIGYVYYKKYIQK